MYADNQYQVTVLKLLALDGTPGDFATWQPAYVPHYLRAVSAVIRNDVGAAGIVAIDKRVTIGSDTNRVEAVAKLTLGDTHTAGMVVYHGGLNVLVSPGEELVVALDDAADTGDIADIILWVEASPERPANNSKLVATVNA